MFLSYAFWGYLAGFVVLLLSTLCFAPKVNKTKRLPLGLEYYMVVGLYAYLVVGYMIGWGRLDWRGGWIFIAGGAAFCLVPAILYGLKKQCFLWAYILAAVGMIAWGGYACCKDDLTFLVVLPPVVGAFLVCSLRHHDFDKVDNEVLLDDLLARGKEYEGLLDEICILAKPQEVGIEDEGKNNDEIKKDIRGMNIALCAPWGSGKSHFFNYLRVNIVKERTEKKGWKKGFVVKNVDVWKIQKEEELWRVVNEVLLYAILGRSGTAAFLAEKNLYHAIFQNTTEGKSAKAIYDLIYKKKDVYSLDLINEELENKRILLIFEDLERADSKILVSLLPLLDRIRKIDNLITICAIDKDELQRKLNREDVDFENYMTKVFDRRIYLPPIRKDGIEKMQEQLLTTRYNSSSLISEFFCAFPHRFDTPRKLLRVCDALESIEHLYFGRLSVIKNFSFKGCEYSECLFRLFVICEVEIIRTCEPKLLDKIATESDIASFLNKFPKDAILNVLSAKNANQVISYDALPSNVDLYRKADVWLYSFYARIKDVILQNDCALSAFAHLYKFREHESLDLCFMYAFYRQYMQDDNFIDRLAKELNPVEENDSSMQQSGYEGSILPMPELTMRIYETMGPPFSDVKQQKDFGDLLMDAKVLEALKGYNKGYPFSAPAITNLYSNRFVKFMLEVFENTKTPLDKKNEAEDLLCELYKTMLVGEQAHVLTPAFYLKNAPEVKGGLDGRYQLLIKNHLELNEFLKKLCSLYAEHVYAYAMKSRLFLGSLLGKEKLTDYQMQAYRNVNDDRIYSAFVEGLYAASKKKEMSLSQSLDSFIYFMGVKYDSTNFISDEYSTYATPVVADFMRHIYRAIEKSHLNSSLELSQKEALLTTYHSTKEILEKDYQSWLAVPDKMSSKPDYLRGISALLKLLEEIKYRYLLTL